jgi:hypothetical protein
MLEEMRERKISADLEIYVLVIEGLALQRRPHAAYQVLAQVCQKRPTIEATETYYRGKRDPTRTKSSRR